MIDMISTIARVCHEANRAICQAQADAGVPPMPAWDEAPEWQRATVIDGVRFHLANPEASASASHDNWARHKIAEGWVWGPEKDPEKKTHPCLVPWGELPPEQRVKDDVFKAIVHAMSGYIVKPIRRMRITGNISAAGFEFEVPDDATEHEIARAAADCVAEAISYGWEPVDGESEG